MINIVHGDILTATEDIICQQVNCQNVMGAGLAKAIYTKWPNVKSKYHICCHAAPSHRSLLGQVQLVQIESNKFVANIFGQFDYGRNPNRCYTDYRALCTAFDTIRQTWPDKSIAIPYGLGCGLANGNWNRVYGIIETYLYDRTVVIYANHPHNIRKE